MPVTNTKLAAAFDAWVDRTDTGRYALRNELHWVYVAIEGAPLFVRSVALREHEVVLRLSDGRDEALDPRTLRADERGVLYCDARAGELTAEFSSHAASSLGPCLVEDDRGEVVFRHRGVAFSLPIVQDPVR